MRASELRLGNYVFKDGVVVKVDGRSIFDISSWEYDAGFLLPYGPIPLTPEWLLFLGLEKKRNHYEKGHALWISLDGVIKGEPSIWIHGNYCPAIKVLHVHQLQNLYFALTGQDFTAAPQLKDLQLAPQELKP